MQSITTYVSRYLLYFLHYQASGKRTKQLQNLQEIPALRKNGTHVRNEQQLLRKINKIIDEGYNRLQIVTDFDNTLTADNGVDGKPVLNSFGE